MVPKKRPEPPSKWRRIGESIPRNSKRSSTTYASSAPSKPVVETRLEPLPEAIIVGYQSVTVTEEDLEPEGCVGRYHRNKGRIELEETLGDGAHKACTLLHEIGHAICYAHGITEDMIVELDGKQLEELYVNTISNGLMQVFRDNPRLVLYLAQRAPLSNVGEQVKRSRPR